MSTEKIIILSDLHFNWWNRCRLKRTEKLFDRICDRYKKDTLILITGDITDSGTKCQCRKARDMIGKLSEKFRVLMIPGNHDYRFFGILLWWERYRPRRILRTCKEPYEIWTEHLGTPLGPGSWEHGKGHWLEEEEEPKGIGGLGVIDLGDMVIIGIDSGDPRSGILTAKGLVSFQLSRALRKLLDIYRSKIRVVMLHHYPFNYGKDAHTVRNYIKQNRMVLKEPDHFMGAVDKNCELLLFGHKHEYKFWKDNLSFVPYIVASNSSIQKDKKDKRYKFVEIRIEKDGKRPTINAEEKVYLQ